MVLRTSNVFVRVFLPAFSVPIAIEEEDLSILFRFDFVDSLIH